MHYLITGHTGFKGAWLIVLLKELGHTVSGISLAPRSGSLFEEGNLSPLLENDIRVDIRDTQHLSLAMESISPEVLIHLAAQPLVRESYLDPRTTFETNVMGTHNLLEQSQRLTELKARLIVTTDKVYRDTGKAEGYDERDALGGFDPYSSSKAMADILTQSWRKSFPAMPTSIARAGNVIGGGDVCPDRLITDLVGAQVAGKSVEIRNPSATRPWQHVLDCLHGYLALIDNMLEFGDESEYNFGPEPESVRSVEDVVQAFSKASKIDFKISDSNTPQPHETQTLTLNSSKSQRELGWMNKLDFQSAIEWTADWHYVLAPSMSVQRATQRQIENYFRL
jgi:CDP-glucose 4,6-dehydratase